jgi:hypothetical protein
MKRRIFVACLLAGSLTACDPLPDDVFVLSPQLLQQRQLETRRYSGMKEEDLLAASSNVLQDLGFSLENSETKLGVLTASKQRTAVNAGEVIGAIIVAALIGSAMPISKDQTIRVSLVVRPVQDTASPASRSAVTLTTDALEAEKEQSIPAIGKELPTKTKPAVDHFVRVTFQRIVRRTDNSEYAETLRDAELLQQFFDKLSRSVFFEGQKI